MSSSRLGPPAGRPSPRATLLLAAALCAAWASTAAAQELRPARSVFAQLHLANGSVEGDISSTFESPGVGLGAEVGYVVSERLEVALGLWAQDLPELRGGYRYAGRNLQGTGATQLQALARLRPLARTVAVGPTAVAPFLAGGLALVSGQGTSDEQNEGPARSAVLGYGPVLGAGLDVALSPRVGLQVGVLSTVVVPDVALDGADPSAFADEPTPPPGSRSDSVPYDVLTNLTAGVRYAFPVRDRLPLPVLEALACPAELALGEPGTFTAAASAAADAVAWDWGDGTASTGTAAAHAFEASGTYTVTATASNARGSASDDCLVTVASAPEPPALATCAVTPATVAPGTPVRVEARVAGDAVSVTVDFGDGTSSDTLPAEHAYDEPGAYTVTVAADSPYGADACALEVAVGDPFCATVGGLETVRFGYGEADLTAGAARRLEATVEALRRCPALCVVVNGYADGFEPGDALGLSRARAEAVAGHYLEAGLEASRVRAVGRGPAPGANAKDDPGPGDGRARRTDTVVTRCGRF